jgi:hypothetical protein
MTQASSQASAFYREVAQKRETWTLRDAGGFPTSPGSSGKRAMPFWSSRSRVEKIIETVRAYHGFTPHCLTWQQFCDSWLPGLEKDGLLVGVNWSGDRALGYDVEPAELRANVEALMENPPQAER